MILTRPLLPFLQMTLPNNVLYKSQGKTNATFAQTDQGLVWTNVDLPKRGASLRLRVKVNVTNCADGDLQFRATARGGSCPVVTATASSTVKHPKNWAACPKLCNIASGIPGVFGCPVGYRVCSFGSFGLPKSTLEECASACKGMDVEFMNWCETCEIPKCQCLERVQGYATGDQATGYALGEPRTPEGPCVR